MATKVLTENEAYKQLNDLFGMDDVVPHAFSVEKVDVIKTGSPMLDRAIGIGGWPRGRFVQLAGKESSGKTLLALTAIAQWQSLDPENCAAFLDAEFTYDPHWAASLGVDNDRVYLVRNNEAARLFTGLVGKMKKNKATGKITKVDGLFDMIENGQTISYIHPITKAPLKLNCGKMGVIVLDSIASINVPMEIEADVGKHHMADMARFLSTELKKLTPGIAKSNVVMIAINQVRVDPNKMFGNPEGSPGGRALKHACSLMIELAPMFGADNVIKNSNDDQIGHRVKAKVSKNKLAPAHKEATYMIKYTKGLINTEEELLEVGCLTGFIERPTSRSYVVNGEKFVGAEKAIEYIRDRKDIIEQQIREHYLANPIEPEGVSIDEEMSDDPFEDDSEYEDI